MKNNVKEDFEQFQQVEALSDNTTFDEYGYQQAGLVGGDPERLELYLNKIRKGFLIDRNNVEELSDKEKLQIESEIETFESEKSKVDNERKTIIEVSIPDVEAKIQNLKENINELGKSITSNSINIPLFVSFLVVFIILTIYIFLFYLVVLFDALAGHISAEIIPEPQAFHNALSYNPMLIVAPVFAAALGMAIHYFLQSKMKVFVKILSVLSIIMLTFAFDFIISYKIYKNLSDTNSLLNIPTDPWYESPNFWIVIIMGFGAYILWSILFNAILMEWDKRDSKKWERKEKEKYENEIEELTNQITSFRTEYSEKLPNKISDFESKIKNLKRKISRPQVSLTKMSQWINSFGIGWNRYFQFPSQNENKMTCKTIIDNYLYEIQKEIDNETV